VLTPNIPEAEQLTGLEIHNLTDMEKAGRALLDLGPAAVLMKGGHSEGTEIVDLLVTREGIQTFSHRRIETSHTHGTGCTLSSAIATGLAQGLALPAAVARAIRYVENAIFDAPGLGAGHGPLNHGHTVSQFD
jgi:hydroxymethylpyrimidine/phosphomethylpyrimidine kinase